MTRRRDAAAPRHPPVSSSRPAGGGCGGARLPRVRQHRWSSRPGAASPRTACSGVKRAANVVAVEVAPRWRRRAGGHPGARRPADDRRHGDRVAAPTSTPSSTPRRKAGEFEYVIVRATAEVPVSVRVRPMPLVAHGLYYSLALVGILAHRRRRVGAAAAAERSGDAAFLLADGGVLRRARVHAERTLRPARLLLRVGRPGGAAGAAAAVPALRARVSRAAESVGPHAMRAARFCPCSTCRRCCSAAGTRHAASPGGLRGPQATPCRSSASSGSRTSIWPLCLLGGLAADGARADAAAIGDGAAAAALDRLGIDASARCRSSCCTCCRCSFGHVPPYAEYTAVLLGCIPLSFASAIVRYRLMDIEVIIKKGLVGATVVLVLAAIYGGHAAAGRAGARRATATAQFLGAVRDARRRAGRALAVARHSGGARSALLPRPLRLPPRARRRSRAI